MQRMMERPLPSDPASPARRGLPRLCFLSYRQIREFALPVVAEYVGRAEIEVVDGTFGDALAIARKEVLQEQLTAMTQNGARRAFDPAEIPALRQLIDDYAEASMPFSPIEYSRSSRKRLVDDLRRAVGYGL